MLKFLAVIMFATVFIDLTLAFIWIGLIGCREVVKEFRTTFPDYRETFDKAKLFLKERKWKR